MTGYTRYTHEAQLDLNRQQLEKTLKRSQTEFAKNAIAQLFSRLGSTLLNLLIESDQPRVRVREANGETVWQAYDPVSRHQAAFNSEEELRAWLEQRYYQ
ncbi:hypothetical protein [Almyronema epifaneia]|uniref:Uncharacterized protein n=1 Tax=Almyronema epifaneia S1 TaxID=2991925 RepID=A0ABW6IG92_9CYAN